MQKGILFANNAFSKLNAGISNVDTTFVSLAGDGVLFPAITSPQVFYVTFFDDTGQIEVVKVTARTGDNFTCVRSQDGTTAPAGGWPANTAFAAQLVREAVNEFPQIGTLGETARNGNIVLAQRIFSL